ncbi:MAG: tetratricopeptide repeat protein [Pleurocapsa sp. SU_196_0]|nr:tetratricopeptide repeat protein [Pleurocapsa sp. SU_196_0]
MLSNLALVEKSTGHYDAALRLSIDALEQQKRIGDFAGEALSLNNLGDLHLVRGDFVAAGQYLEPGLALCDRHGLVSTRAWSSPT